jgi:hypothetical protein
MFTVRLRVPWHQVTPWLQHNYTFLFRPAAFFTSWPRLRLRVSPSRRDWDYDCRFCRVSIMVLWSLCGFAFHGVELPCLPSSNRHLTVVTKIKTSYRINTVVTKIKTLCFPVTPWLRLRLRVPSHLYYGFTFTLRLRVPWRREPIIMTRLHPLNKHRTGSLSFCCVPFRRLPSLRLCVSSSFYYGFTFTLPLHVSFVTSWLRLQLRVSSRLYYGLRSLASRCHDYDTITHFE